ncbi:MAG: N-acetyltransferase [Dehalococcoidia bacterium]|nr:N-acetyltransferase [Dehalococcoidia bacterium]
MNDTTFNIQPAKIGDVVEIHKLVNRFADVGEMLPRSMGELYENVRDFVVVKDDDGELAGCASLHVVWEDLAEIKAVAVTEEWQSKGLGAYLVTTRIEEAKELGLATVFCLTHKPAFYEKLGFSQVDVMTLPRKVWGECMRCPKFPACNEIAMVVHLTPDGAASLKSPQSTNTGAWEVPMMSSFNRPPMV